MDILQVIFIVCDAQYTCFIKGLFVFFQSQLITHKSWVL